MCLTDVKRGQSVHVTRIEDDDVRTHLIRLGIGEGSAIKCVERIPLGPFLVRHNRQEIAIGRKFAGKIHVKRSISS